MWETEKGKSEKVRREMRDKKAKVVLIPIKHTEPKSIAWWISGI